MTGHLYVHIVVDAIIRDVHWNGRTTTVRNVKCSGFLYVLSSVSHCILPGFFPSVCPSNFTHRVRRKLIITDCAFDCIHVRVCIHVISC